MEEPSTLRCPRVPLWGSPRSARVSGSLNSTVMLHLNHRPGRTVTSTRGRHRHVCTPGRAPRRLPGQDTVQIPWAGHLADPRAGRLADPPAGHYADPPGRAPRGPPGRAPRGPPGRAPRRPPGQGTVQNPHTASRGRLPAPAEARHNPGLRVGMEGEPVSRQRQVGRPVHMSSTRGRLWGHRTRGCPLSGGPRRGGPCRGGRHGGAP